MKKLNRKGFTLIELLAVIVIMAIILIVTVPNIIQSINDARVSSLHNLTVSTAGSFENVYAQDLLVTDPAKKALGDIVVGSDWTCLNDTKLTSKVGSKRSLADVLGIPATDIKLDGTVHNKTAAPTSTTVKAATCSAVRVVNGNVEFVLIAKAGGRFAVAGKTVYAYSKDSAGVQF